ncbi:MAG: CrcB family protein [Planctomycetes bacterium]|nr:CrcB family protein [Planctomycetota bacterium]
MKLLLLVCLGGAVGSGLRYGTDRLILAQWPREAAAFPWATLAVNLVGCLIAGLLLGSMSREGVKFADELKVLLITGLCGGLTTFSAFALQTMQANPGKALANVAASVVGGLALAWLGLWLSTPGNA